MYLVVKSSRSGATGATVQSIIAVPTDEGLEEYVLRHGLENCEVYEATKLQMSVNWKAKVRNVPSD